MRKYVNTCIPVATLGAGILLLSACTTTQKVELNQTSINCGLLGDACAKLVAGGKDQAALRYVDPAVQWTQYNKILIEPVSFWGGAATSVSGADQRALVDYFTQQLHVQLGKKFTIVDKPAPGTIRLAVAMVDAETATPVLRTVSMLVPQAHMLANLKYVATGTFPFVGGAQAEAKLTDAVSGALLAAAADKRIGGGNATTAFQWQLGDAENAIDKWCEMTAERLSAWTSGTAAP